MPIELTDAEQKTLIKHAKTTYLAYLALDTMRKNSICKVTRQETENLTLQALSIQLVKTNKYKEQIKIHNKVCEIQITPHDSYFAITINRVIPEESQVKRLDKYTNDDLAALLCNSHFTLHPEGDNYTAGIKPYPNIILGGPGKIDLYRSHLVNLYNIIQRIEQGKTDIMLVALATGSGKTFTQALWLQILFFAKMIGIFTMPHNLVGQFRKDMDRLLPAAITDTITLLPEGDDESLTQALQSSSTTSIITSAENLLDNCYTILLKLPKNTRRIFLSFDEHHAIAQFESRYKKSAVLSKKYLSLYLTATPSQETYTACGSNPVAMMSPAQKKQAGQGQLSEIKTIQTEFDTDLNRRYTPFGKKFIGNEIIAFVVKFFIPEVSSAAVEAIKLLPYQVSITPGENNHQPTIQMPMARKMLWLIDDNESLVNFFCNYNSKSTTTSLYANGALNSATAGKLDLDMIARVRDENDEITTENVSLETKRREVLLDAQTIGMTEEAKQQIQDVAQKSLSKQVEENMLHGLIEYVLTDVTNLSQIELNEIRQKNMQDLINKVMEFYANNYKENRLHERLEKKVGTSAAELISPLLNIIDGTLKLLVEQNNVILLSEYCTNDFLNTSLFDFFQSIATFKIKFGPYCEHFKVVAVMENMEDAESPVDDSKPFYAMEHEKRQAFKDKKLDANAKKRKRSSAEQMAGILGSTIEDDYFSPKYLDESLTEQVIDILFKFGFIGIYISNKKAIGFNDPNLQTVVSVIENDLTKNSNPTVQVQSYGRTRGLDSTVKPAYINVFGRRVKPQFDLRLLDKSTDYYPKYFRALRAYNKHSIKTLSDELTKQILQEYNNCSDANGTVDAKKLKRKTLVLIAKTLRKLNILNTFDIQLSRAQLSQILINISRGIDEEIHRIKHPYEVSSGAKFGVSFLKGIFTAINFPKDITVFLSLKAAERRLLKEGSLQQADKLYLKIIRSGLTFGTIESLALVMKEFLTFAEQLVNKTPTIENNNLTSLFSLVKLIKKSSTSQSSTGETPFTQGINDPQETQEQLLKEYTKLIADILINFEDVFKQLINHFSPILFNPEFLKIIDIIIGNLDESDLACLIYTFITNSEGPSLNITLPENIINKLHTGGPDESLKMLSTQAAKDFFKLIDKLRKRQTNELVEMLESWFFKIIIGVLGTILKELGEKDIDSDNIQQAMGLLTLLQHDPENPIYKTRLTALAPTIISQLLGSEKNIDITTKIMQTKSLRLLINTVISPVLIVMALNESICYFHRSSLTFPRTETIEPISRLLVPHVSRELTEHTLPFRSIELDLSLAKNMLKATKMLDKVKQAASTENTSNLESLKENVIKGVWWKLKYSTWKFSITRIFKNAFFAVKEGLLYIWSGIKFVASKVKQFIWQDHKNQDDNVLQETLETDVNYTAEFTKRLNAAAPITAKQTQQRNCPVDALAKIIDNYEDEQDSSTLSF